MSTFSLVTSAKVWNPMFITKQPSLLQRNENKLSPPLLSSLALKKSWKTYQKYTISEKGKILLIRWDLLHVSYSIVCCSSHFWNQCKHCALYKFWLMHNVCVGTRSSIAKKFSFVHNLKQVLTILINHSAYRETPNEEDQKMLSNKMVKMSRRTKCKLH